MPIDEAFEAREKRIKDREEFIRTQEEIFRSRASLAPKITRGVIHRELASLIKRGALVEDIRWVVNNQLEDEK